MEIDPPLWVIKVRMMVMMMAMMMAMTRTHLPSDPQVSLDPDGKAEGGRVVFQGGG